MVPDEEIEKILRRTSDIKQTVNLFIEQANQKGGLDNIAVLVAEKEEKR